MGLLYLSYLNFYYLKTNTQIHKAFSVRNAVIQVGDKEHFLVPCEKETLYLPQAVCVTPGLPKQS
jgi:hypothetical protein